MREDFMTPEQIWARTHKLNDRAFDTLPMALLGVALAALIIAGALFNRFVWIPHAIDTDRLKSASLGDDVWCGAAILFGLYCLVLCKPWLVAMRDIGHWTDKMAEARAKGELVRE